MLVLYFMSAFSLKDDSCSGIMKTVFCGYVRSRVVANCRPRLIFRIKKPWVSVQLLGFTPSIYMYISSPVVTFIAIIA